MAEINFDKSEYEYFEKEMNYLRERCTDFSSKYPSIATRLKLSRSGSDDPHIQQMIETFAFLSSKLQRQIDNSHFQLGSFLVETLYPGQLTPIPSLSITEITPSKKADLSQGYLLEKNSHFYTKVDGKTTCHFKTCYPTVILPVEVLDFRVESSEKYVALQNKSLSVYKLKLKLNQGQWKNLNPCKVRLHIYAPHYIANYLYDMIFDDGTAIYRLDPAEQQLFPLGKDCVKAVGFEDEENVLEYAPTSHDAYRYLQEYLLFPEKFLFFDLMDFQDGVDGQEVDILFAIPNNIFKNLDIHKNTLRPNCCPVVNLFEMKSDSFVVNHFQNDYSMYTKYNKKENVFVHSLQKVFSIDADTKETTEIRPVLELLVHANHPKHKYYYEFHRSLEDENKIFIRFFDSQKRQFSLDETSVYGELTASNGNLCHYLLEGDSLSFEKDYPISNVSIVKKPTKFIDFPKNDNAIWTLISSFYTNRRSLTNESELLDLLNQIMGYLCFNDFETMEKTRARRDSIEKISIEKSVRQIGSEAWRGAAFGFHYNFHLNVHKFSGESYQIFSKVMYYFLYYLSEANTFISMNVLSS